MKRLALFDLDNTLLSGDSDHAWGEYLADQGMVDAGEHKRQNDAFWEDYKAGSLDIQAYLRFALSAIAGKSDTELAPLRERYIETRIKPMIRPGALALLRQHQHDLCAIVTATNAFVTRPIADLLGVTNLIACDVEMSDGRYTGEPAGIPSFREGKIVRVESWLAAQNLTLNDFDETWFYSDSRNDLPLLLHVTHPVAVDPDDALRAVANERQWPVISLD